MTLHPHQFKAMHSQLKKEGGFSVNAQTGEAPKDGYMVSVPGFEHQVRSQNIAPAHIQEFVEKHAAELSKDERFVGGWDGGAETSLDVSQNIRPNRDVAREYGDDVADADARTSAMDLSIARNQEAAWDVKRGRELPNADFDPTGRRGNV